MSNAAILYNKTYRIKQQIPTCVNTRVNGNNARCQRTKNAAIRCRINQELMFQYAKKKKTQRAIVYNSPGMHNPLANYMATHSVDNR